MPFGGVIVNRVHHSYELGKLDVAQVASELARRLGGEERMILVPYLNSDVHDIDGLRAVHRYLWATEEERTAMLADVVA